MLKYVDSMFDEAYYVKLHKDVFGSDEVSAFWGNENYLLVEKYFKAKKIDFKLISFRQKVFQKYLDQGIPIGCWYASDDDFLKELYAILLQRAEKRAKCASASAIKSLLADEKNSTKKMLKKVSYTKGKVWFGGVTGYNAQTNEYHIYFEVLGTSTPVWITEDEYKKLPLSNHMKEDAYRSFEF